MIQSMRAKQFEKMRVMQLIADKKFKEQKNKANQMKIGMAAKLLKAYEKGNKDTCASKDTKVIEAYCNKKYADNPANNQACKVPADFCFFCCEREFGAMRMTERKECY